MANWNPRANAIFLDALDIAAPEDRRRFLEEACGVDEALRADVNALCSAHDAASSIQGPSSFSLGLTVDLDSNSSKVKHDDKPGNRIGPYKLLEPIGEGGMGTVWMAEQTEPVKRMVALKLIKTGMDSAQVLARFDAERQALALMDHPNIAKVLDAATTPDGRPYFVMELVKGMTITKFCDERRFRPRERLALFISVCHAVQHAHQKGIIHRDLKPSNVLIALYDGMPVPKVIDFGIAKATQEKLTERTLFTGFGALVGTLEYMSPEQAELNQLDVDTRSDIYSLGVLLYELLTGSTPLGRDRIKGRAILEVLLLIHEDEPPPPSTRLSKSETLITLSEQRQMEPAKLAKLMRGELDWIVMKALEKNRTRRYETALNLADDIDRYLKDEPVQAGPPSATYRLRKFVKRNRGAVVASAVVLVTLVAGIFATTMALMEARAQRDRAEMARREAKTNEDKARNEETLAKEARASTERLAQNLRDEQKEKETTIQRSLPAFVHAAKLLANNGDLKGAQRQVELTLLYKPDHAEASFFKGLLLIAQKEFDSGRAELGRYLKLAPDDADAKELVQLCAPDRNDDLKFRLALAAVMNRQRQHVMAAGLLEDKRDDLAARQELLVQYRNIVDQHWPGVGARIGMQTDSAFVLNLNILNGDRFESLQPLQNLKLEQMGLHGLLIKDLSPLKNMPLTNLYIWGCDQVRDLSPLQGMPLIYLCFNRTGIQDLKPLQGIKTLRWLCMEGTKVEDLTPLKGLPLAYLDMAGCPRLQDLSPLKGMPLQVLHLYSYVGSRITDLGPLAELKELRELDIHSLQLITDLTPLKGLPLKSLSISGTQVQSLEPLKGMQLTTLKWEPAQFTPENIKIVRAMKSLETIVLNRTQVYSAADFWKRFDAGEWSKE